MTDRPRPPVSSAPLVDMVDYGVRPVSDVDGFSTDIISRHLDYVVHESRQRRADTERALAAGARTEADILHETRLETEELIAAADEKKAELEAAAHEREPRTREHLPLPSED